MTTPAKPSDFTLLLEVFRDGLRFGVVSVKDVVGWADALVMLEDDADYFFIELAMGVTKNGLIETLNEEVVISGDPTCARVLLGLIYKKLTDNKSEFSTESAYDLMEDLLSLKSLSSYENEKRYDFNDYDIFYGDDLKALRADMISSLVIYEAFNLANFKKWQAINIAVESVLSQQEREQKLATALVMKQWKRKAAVRNIKRHSFLILYFGIPISAIIITDAIYIRHERSLISMLESHEDLFLFNVFGCYFTLGSIFKIWNTQRRLH